MSAATLTNGTAKNTVSIKSIGPIASKFTLDLSAGPGVYVARAGKGEGKSTLIRCVLSILLGKPQDLSVTDNCLEGSVSGFGRELPIGKGRRVRGDLEVGTLESEKFSLIDVIDPAGVGDDTKDARRILALASLCGVKADASIYYDLFGTKQAFESIVAASDLKTDDPVVLAKRIKRRLDDRAREMESLAEHEMGHARGCEDSLAGIDLAGPCDRDELDAAADAAVMRETGLKAQAATAARAAKEVAAARENLAALESGYDGPTSRQAAEKLADAVKQQAAAVETVKRIEAELSKAKAEAALAEQRYRAAMSAAEAAPTIRQTQSQLRNPHQLAGVNRRRPRG